MKFTDSNIIDNDWIRRVCQGKAIYDWNSVEAGCELVIPEPSYQQLSEVKLRSECFRDALGGVPRLPSISERQQFILDLEKLGVEMVTLDIYSSRREEISKSNKMTLKLLGWMAEKQLSIRPVILARAVDEDIEYLKKAYDVNKELVGLIFQDLSEVRRMVEGWGSFVEVLASLAEKVEATKKYGLSVMAFTENLSITSPEDIEKYVESMCDSGADWIGIADTAGRLTPYGAARITNYVAERISKHNSVGIVFHTHNDWGNATANSMAAIAAGASVVDVVTNGVGERAGNTDLIEMVANIEYRMRTYECKGGRRYDLSRLPFLSQSYARITSTEVGVRQPMVGENVFSTTYGIHANYYYKVALLVDQMRREGIDKELIDRFEAESWRVYSASSPTDLNLRPEIRLSQFSGASNVIMRLHYLGLISSVSDVDRNHPKVQEILSAAKAGWGELSDRVVRRIWLEK